MNLDKHLSQAYFPEYHKSKLKLERSLHKWSHFQLTTILYFYCSYSCAGFLIENNSSLHALVQKFSYDQTDFVIGDKK
jgi:uncharacterized protein YutD